MPQNHGSALFGRIWNHRWYNYMVLRHSEGAEPLFPALRMARNHRFSAIRNGFKRIWMLKRRARHNSVAPFGERENCVAPFGRALQKLFPHFHYRILNEFSWPHFRTVSAEFQRQNRGAEACKTLVSSRTHYVRAKIYPRSSNFSRSVFWYQI